METGLVIAAILNLLDWLEPRIADLRAKGEISQDDQLKLKNRIDSFRDGSAFSGPEWGVETDGQATSNRAMPSSGARQIDPAGAPQGTEPSNTQTGEGAALLSSGGGTPPPAPVTAQPAAPESQPVHDPGAKPAEQSEGKEEQQK